MYTYTASEPDGMHVIIDRHLITGQNDTSTLSAVQNLILLCNARSGGVLFFGGGGVWGMVIQDFTKRVSVSDCSHYVLTPQECFVKSV